MKVWRIYASTTVSIAIDHMLVRLL
ncbi:hypothetical protein LINPERPRIM_LOCUS40353 [Linum perenne]